MKALTLFVLIGAISTSFISSAKANEIDLGIATPKPTGISLKVWLNENNAVDVLGAWNINDEKIYIHGNYLTHDFNMFDVDGNNMPFYYGLGFRVLEEDDGEDTTVGLRIPFGISYYLDIPFEFFGELAPRLDIVPDTNFGMDVMIGVRYRFNAIKR